MSRHVNWIALERAEPARLLEELGLREIGAGNDERAAPYAYSATPGGGLVLVGWSMKLKLERLLPALSAERQVLAGEVSDIVMVSSLQAWRAGARLWSVTHNPEEGVETLEIAGEPPSDLSEIEARLAACQAEETDAVDHLFDAPLELGERLCGYRPDTPQPGPWIMLAPAPRRRAPVLSSLPAAIRAELMPALADLGWTVAPIRLSANNRQYDASRIRQGRVQALRFLWRDDRRRLEVLPSFAILEGAHPDGQVIVSGNLRHDPPLLERIKTWGAALARPKSYEEKVSAAVAEAREELAANDRFIGEEAANLSS